MMAYLIQRTPDPAKEAGVIVPHAMRFPIFRCMTGRERLAVPGPQKAFGWRRNRSADPPQPQRLLALLGLAFIVLAAPAGAQRLEDQVKEVTLKNGMKFLFVERHEAPVFSAMIAYRVGGVDEHVGITGIAHMFEHMAFKGTQVIGTRNLAAEEAVMKRADAAAEALRRVMAQPNPDPATLQKMRADITKIEAEARPYIVKDELDEIFTRNGAYGTNAFTSKDITAYHLSLPSNRFELWAMMEAQSLATPVLREFYSERDVVAEERRMRIDADPEGKLLEKATAVAYDAHPYKIPTIGYMSDIQNLTRPMAIAFRKIYYVPNNAVGVIVGDVKPADALPVLERYFGPIPAGPPPPPVVTKETPQEGERHVNVEFEAEPEFALMVHKPAPPDPDDTVFSVIDALLTGYTGGRTSRLYTALVKKQQIATGVGSSPSWPGERYPNLFYLSATPRHPHTVAEVITAMDAEFERLKTEPVPAEELQKVKNNVNAAFTMSLSSNLGLAEQLAETQAITGDWRNLIRQRDALMKVTPADVMRVAKQYLNRDNRTVAEIVPPAAGAEKSAPEAAPAKGEAP